MKTIIAVLLLLFFMGTGTFFNIILLNSAESILPWIATLICIISIAITIYYIWVRDQLNIKALVIIMGIFGVIQLIIIGMIDIPSYWEDDEFLLRLYAAFLSQPVNCLIGYGMAKLVKDWVESKLKDNLALVMRCLEKQKNALENINTIIKDNNDINVLSEHLISLFLQFDELDLYSAYIEKKLKKEQHVLQSIKISADKLGINMQTEGRLLSEIEKELNYQIKEMVEKIEFWGNKRFTAKDYLVVASELKKVRPGR